MSALALFLVFLAQNPAPTARELIEKLGSESFEERERASGQLRLMGADAFRELKKVVDHPDKEIATRARALSLEIVPDPLRKAFPGLEKRLLEGEDYEWTRIYLDAPAREIDLRDLAGVASTALRGARTVVEKRTAMATAERGRHAGALPEVRKLVKDPEWEVRVSAVWVVGELGGASDVALLEEALRDPDSSVRGQAVSSLGLLKGKGHAERILVLLRDKDLSVRIGAADSARRMNVREAVPDLLALLKEKDMNARAMAMLALADLGAPGAVAPITELLNSSDTSIRLEAVRALVCLDAKASISAVERRLQDQDGGIRGEAALALGKLGSKESIPQLRKLLEDPSSWARREAARALCLLGRTEGAALLVQGSGPRECLNAVRNPGLWAARSKPYRWRLEGVTRGAVFEDLKKESGVTFEVSEDVEAELLKRWRSAPAGSFTRHHVSFWDALEDALYDSGLEPIVEENKVRLLSSREAYDFWEKWWRKEAGK